MLKVSGVSAGLISVLTVAGCTSKGSGGVPDPAGTAVTTLSSESGGLDFETGALGGIGADLEIDELGNLIATDRLSSMGPLGGVAEVTVLPAGSAWLVTTQAIRGHGYVVKSDESNAYAVFVSDAGSTSTIHWRALPDSASLRVSLAGEGLGSVTSSPAGIACVEGAAGWDCGEPFATTSVVALSAVPVPTSVPGCPTDISTSTHTGWSGIAGCDTAASCDVTVESTATAVATFVPLVDVMVPDPAAAVANHGTVTVGTTVAPSCNGTSCHYLLPAGTVVVLTAVDGSGTFTQWSNEVSPACGNQTDGYYRSANVCGGQTATCTLDTGVDPGCGTGCIGTVGMVATPGFT